MSKEFVDLGFRIWGFFFLGGGGGGGVFNMN